MKILVFEWFIGGGMLADPSAPNHLLREGKAMRDAIADDFTQLGHNVITLQDVRMPVTCNDNVSYRAIDHYSAIRPALEECARQADCILVIAPESDGCLLSIVSWLTLWHQKLISPNQEFVRMASDKGLTKQRLHKHGVPVPAGSYLTHGNLSEFNSLSLPWVIKPVDGCGSEGIHFVCDPTYAPGKLKTPVLVESFVCGTPVSISVVAKNGTFQLLPPVQQLFDRYPIGAYAGCHHPLPVGLQKRAESLASEVVAAMPKTVGYFGIDMVLSDKIETADVVIEVNPRLTSSYLRLREICQFSIGQQMLA